MKQIIIKSALFVLAFALISGWVSGCSGNEAEEMAKVANDNIFLVSNHLYNK